MHSLKQVWYNLTSPSPGIEALDERRQAQFIASVLLGFLLVGTLVAIVSFYAVAPPAQRMSLVSGSAMTAFLVFALYLLSRTRAYRAAIWLTGALFVFLILISFVSSLTGGSRPLDENIMLYLAVPVLLASVLTNTRTTIGVIAVCILSILLIFLFVPISLINVVVGPLTFVIVISTLLVISARQRDLQEGDRRAAVEESETRFRALLEATYEGVIITRKTRILAANSGFHAMFDCEPESVLGLSLTQFIPLLAADGVETSWPVDRLVETRGRRRDGSRIDIEFLTKEQVYQGEPAWVIAVRDITERKLTAQALQRAQRLDSLGLLAGGIAHDFNNLLTGIITQSTLAALRLDKSDPARHYVDQALLSAEQAANLTQQLSAYVGKGVARRDTIDLNALIRQTVPVLKTSIPPNIDLLIDLADVPCPVLGATSQLQQVILNLVINAGQAIGAARGSIHICTHMSMHNEPERYKTYIGKAQLEPGPVVELTVRDDGPGMDDAVRQHIFEPFFSTKAAREGGGGHGLGLSTTLGIVRSHNGAIEVKSRKGQGTEFSIVLPAAEVEQKVALGTPDADSAEIQVAGTPLILVVDDESAVRDAVCDVLEMHNMRALTAYDGVQALEQFAAHQDDIAAVILDMRMPNKDGEQTLVEIRALDPDAKIILTSGFPESDVLEKYTHDHYTTFLTKPFGVGRLMNAVSDSLGIAQSELNGAPTETTPLTR